MTQQPEDGINTHSGQDKHYRSHTARCRETGTQDGGGVVILAAFPYPGTKAGSTYRQKAANGTLKGYLLRFKR